MPGILVFAEQRNQKVKNSVYELLAAASGLSGTMNEEIIVLMAGHQCAEAAKSMLFDGRLLLADTPELGNFSSEAYTRAIQSAIEKAKPSVILFPASAMGKDLSPRIAARMGASFAGDCISLEAEGRIAEARQAFQSARAGGNLAPELAAYVEQRLRELQ